MIRRFLHLNFEGLSESFCLASRTLHFEIMRGVFVHQMPLFQNWDPRRVVTLV